LQIYTLNLIYLKQLNTLHLEVLFVIKGAIWTIFGKCKINS
jgi:hypothetical protein